MRRSQSNPGYILALALMIISLSVVLVTYIFDRGTIFVPFAQTVIERERAKMLAFGGLQVAMSQLASIDEKETKKSPAEKPEAKKTREPEEEAKQFLEKILPIINRWQIFELKEEIDGVDGKIALCISCEDGKIDINKIYDFKEHKFVGEGENKGDFKKIVQEVCSKLRSFVGGGDLFKPIEKFLKERKFALNDVTELLTIKECEVFKRDIFYEPPGYDEQQVKKGKRPVYLTDIFTVQSKKTSIDPWLLSDSLCALLDIQRVERDDVKKRKDKVPEWLKEFKASAEWNTDWDKLLLPVYGKGFNLLPKNIASIFASKFEPKIFSVLSYGNVGNVTQRFFAILERGEVLHNNSSAYIIKIKKLYWL